jgi:hypothetical protein
MATLGLRVQIRHWRGLIWVVTVGLGLFSAWNVKQIWDHNKGNLYKPKPRDKFDQVIASAQGDIPSDDLKPPSWTDYQALAKTCPINGYEPVKPTAEPVATTQEPVKLPEKPIRDVLVVTQVIEAPDDLGRVVVKYKDDTTKPLKDETILKVGAPLAPPYDGEPFNAVLKATRADTAVFQWCGKEVEVRPVRKEDLKGDKTKPATATAAVAKSTSTTISDDEKSILEKYKATDKTATYAENAYVVGKRDYDEIAGNPDLYLRDARISERPGPNKTTELVVGALGPKKALATEYGIQANDVLVSINGVAMNTKAQAYDYVRNNSDLEKYVVVIKRSGREISKTVLVNRHR